MPFQNIKFVHQDYTLTVEKGRNFACSINLITRAAFTKDSTNSCLGATSKNRGHFGQETKYRLRQKGPLWDKRNPVNWY